MIKNKPMNQVEIFFKRARTHYNSLGFNENKISENDKLFLSHIGISPTNRNSWYKQGIRRCYFKTLDFLDAIKALEEDKKKLKEDNEILREKFIAKNDRQHIGS